MPCQTFDSLEIIDILADVHQEFNLKLHLLKTVTKVLDFFFFPKILMLNKNSDRSTDKA
jgi:hypothetical protein